MHFILFKSLLITLFLVSFQAKTQDYVYQNYTSEDGLPSSEVHSLVQDSLGYVWIATDRGISRFDGENFQVYNDEKQLGDLGIYKIFKHSDGRFWFTNGKNQLHHFDPYEFPFNPQPFIYNGSLNEAFLSLNAVEHIRSFWEDEKGNYFVTFLVGTGAIKIDNEGSWEEFYKDYGNDLQLDKSENCIKISIENENSIFSETLVDSNYKSKVLLFEKGELLHVWDFDFGYTMQRMYGIAAKLKLKDGFCFLIGDFLIQKKGGEFRYQKLNIEGICLAKRGELILVGTYNGVYVLDKDLKVVKHFLSDYAITSLVYSDEGHLWISTSNNGLYLVLNTSIRNLDGLPGSMFNFYRIESFEEMLILQSWNSDLLLIDRKFNEKTVIPDAIILGGIVNSLNNEDLSIYFGKQLKVKKTSRIIESDLFGVSSIDSEVFNGYKDGLSYQQNDSLKFHFFDSGGINEAVKKTDSTGLLATDFGVFEYDYGNMKMTQYSDLPIFLKRFKQIKRFGEGYLCGSSSDGLLYFNGDIHYNLVKRNGLLSNAISDICVVDDSIVWVATYDGLSKITFSPVLGRYSIEYLDKSAGLISNEVNCLEEFNDSIWVCTKKGVNVIPKNYDFTPSILSDNVLHFDSILIDKEKVQIKQQLEIVEGQEFDVYFWQIVFSVQSEVQYEFRYNQNQEWEKTNEGHVKFPNLGVGSYQIEIRSLYKNEKSDPLTFALIVNPPIYKKWWALAIYSLIFLVSLYLLFQLLLKRSNKKRQAELEKVQLELKALVSQMNPHFTFNTINSIQHYIIQKDKKEALNYLTEFAVLIRKTLDFSRREYISLQEEIEFLELYVLLENRRFENEVKIIFNVDCIKTEAAIKFPSLLLQPIIENSIEHALQTIQNGHIKVDFKENPDHFYVEIKDNGVGFDPQEKKNGMNESHGLNILKERI